MNVGVIGSGSIGPDLAYGFVSALAGGEGGKVFLLDVRREALDAGIARVRGYVGKAVARGKLSAKAAAAIEASLVPTLEMRDLAGCEYVLEAATEDLATKRKIIRDLERTVDADCLIGFATSGIPRAWIAAEAVHPERCFVNHPFFPAWRSLPMEVVLSGDDAFGDRMTAVLKKLGKIPIVTADVPCFAADDIFCNYCAEAVRVVTDGLATPAQVDRIVDDAIGGGGPFNVMDLTRGNLLNAHCLELMRDAPTGSAWFAPPAEFRTQANTPWHDRANPGDSAYDGDTARVVLDRILAVLIGRTYFVVDRAICDPASLNWLSRTALGFRDGLLDLAESLGAERVRAICTAYAATHPGFEVPQSIAAARLASFRRNVRVEARDGIATVTIFRPEVKNALDERTMQELDDVFRSLDADDAVRGVILTSYDGSLAGADINELAALATPEEAEAKCLRGHAVLDRIARCRKPVVAAVDGPVLGGGAELSMACHARVAGRNLLLGQPEVNLGIIPGYGGTQRLPRLVGVAKGVEMLRTGKPIGAAEACAAGWAAGEPADDMLAAAAALIGEHLAGRTKIAPVDPSPLALPERLPDVDIGQLSVAIDTILVAVLREGLPQPQDRGLAVEAAGFARCKKTADYAIGMKNFIQNGPRVPAVFMHE